MDFKRTLFFAAGFLLACSTENHPGQDKGIIGQALENTSPLYQFNGYRSNEVFFFDAPTKRILKLNLASMSIERSYLVTNQDEDHTILSDLRGNYVIDFSKKHLQVYTVDGRVQTVSLPFQGTPVSAAFQPESGILAMQDDLQSILLMKINDDGTIEKTWLGGPLLGSGKTVLAGDIGSDGRLVMAMSDNSIVVVDVTASIDQKNGSMNPSRRA